MIFAIRFNYLSMLQRISDLNQPGLYKMTNEYHQLTGTGYEMF